MIDRKTLLALTLPCLLQNPETGLYFKCIKGCGKVRVWVADPNEAMKMPAGTHPDSLTCAKNLVEEVTKTKVEWVRR